jgi:surface carbohydrate biosynthesis protein
MMDNVLPLIIPVENQVRELDPKVLLACIAAREGLSSIIGSHREIDFRVASFPRSIYVCKSMTERNLNMFYIMHKIGHEIVTWDEEALVHLPPETYYSRRLDSKTIRYVSHLFAWGEDNAELWRHYPELPAEMPVHVTGNPRSDMLRKELQPFYKAEADAIRQKYGDFILVNTNFNHVNAFFPAQNLFRPAKKPGKAPAFGKAAVGMSRQYAEGLRDHKEAIFTAFKEMIPELERVFSQCMIVVRPHPTESQNVYREIADRCERVIVTNEGNVVPWLMATKVVIHNGCTTGVEAFEMGVPSISYRAKVNDAYDNGFYRLPNMVSHQCFDMRELCDALNRIFSGNLGPVAGEDHKAEIERYLAAREGPLACERIIEILKEISTGGLNSDGNRLGSKSLGWSLANGRRAVKFLRKFFRGKAAPPQFHRHRYPGISLQELRSRISRFKGIMAIDADIKAEQVGNQIFRIRV